MTLFPVFIAICIAAVFHGATIATGATAFRRALLGYVQILFWWPLIVYYYNDLKHPSPDREVAMPALYNQGVCLLLPLVFTALYTFAIANRKLQTFTRLFAIAVACWLMIDWFYLALALPYAAPDHDFIIGWEDIKPLAASNGCALAVAALALAWHAINPKVGGKSASTVSEAMAPKDTALTK